MDYLRPLFSDQKPAKDRMPEPLRGHFDRIEEQARTVSDPHFRSREQLTLWMSHRTGIPADKVRASLPGLTRKFFNTDDPGDAVNQIAEGYKLTDPYVNAVRQYEADVETAPASTNIVWNGLATASSELVGVLGDTIGAGYSLSATVLQEMAGFVDPRVNADGATSNIDRFWQAAGMAMQMKSEEYREIAALHYQTDQVMHDLLNTSSEFRDSALGQITAAVGSIPATVVMAMSGIPGLVAMTGMFFGQKEQERMGSDPEYQANVQTAFENLFSAAPQVLIERAVGVERIFNRAWKVTPKMGDKVRLGDGLKNMGRRGLRASLEEGIAEPLQGFWDDVASKLTYDEQMELVTMEAFKSRAVEAALGATVGFMFGTALSVDTDIERNNQRKSGQNYLLTRQGGLLTPKDFEIMRSVYTDEEILAGSPDPSMGKTVLDAANGDRDAYARYQEETAKALFEELGSSDSAGRKIGEVNGAPAIITEDGKPIIFNMADPGQADLWRRYSNLVSREKRAAKNKQAEEDAVGSVLRELQVRYGENLTVEQAQNARLADMVAAGEITQVEMDNAIEVATNLGQLAEGMDPAEVTIKGSNQLVMGKNDLLQIAVRLASNSNTTTVIEEVGEGWLKQGVELGQFSQDEVTEARRAFYQAKGEADPNADHKDVARANTEWFSATLVDYALSKRKTILGVDVASKVGRWLKSLGDSLRSMLKGTAKMKKLMRDGKLDPKLESWMRQALGDPDAIAEQVALDAKAAQVQMAVQSQMERVANSVALKEAEQVAAAKARIDALLDVQAQRMMEEEGWTDSPRLGHSFQLAPPTQTDAFKKWFGDSKVVDSDGKPLRVFHGSRDASFTVFDKAKVGTGIVGTNPSGGFYFSDNRTASEFFADQIMVEKTGDQEITSDDFQVYGDGPFFILSDDAGINAGPYGTEAAAEQAAESIAEKWNSSEVGDVVYENDNIMELYLKMENPLRVESGNIYDLGDAARKAYLASDQAPTHLKDGTETFPYDGIIAENVVDGDTESTVYIVFEPTQIKSATGNRGTYDPTNPDITFQLAPPVNSDAFKRWSKGAPVIGPDDIRYSYQGGPAVFRMFHGTTADFSVFDMNRAEVGSDYGAGLYFSNTPEDVGANYSGLGPDLKMKIEREAERISNKTLQDPDDPQVIAQARAKYMQHDGATMPVYVRALNPVVIGGSNPSRVEEQSRYNEDDLEGLKDEAIEALIEEEGVESAAELEDYQIRQKQEELADENGYYNEDEHPLLKAINRVAQRYNGVETDSIMEVMEIIYAEPSYADVVKVLKEKVFVFAEDDVGEPASTEAVRQVFAEMGHDAIVDFEVDEKFGSQKRIGQAMEGMNPDTVHVIAFDPNQIKSAIGNRGTFDPTNPDITFQLAPPVNSDAFSMDSIAKPTPEYDASRQGTALQTHKGGVTTRDTNTSLESVTDKGLELIMGMMTHYTKAKKVMGKVKDKDRAMPTFITKHTDPKKRRRAMLRMMVDNLVALHDAFPEEFRARATHWYDGARKIADFVAGEYNITPEQSAGIMAALSPQKDWFQNVQMGINLVDVMRNEWRTTVDLKEMQEAYTAMITKDGNMASRIKYLATANGSTLEQLWTSGKKEEAAWALRLISEHKHGYDYDVIAPEGFRMDAQTTKADKRHLLVWQSIGPIRKSMEIYLDGSYENISLQLGEGHKVRSFNNNIIAPNSPYGDVTSDTHNVAATLLVPLGGSSYQVTLNLSGNKVGNGNKGTYWLHQEAVRMAAAKVSERDGVTIQPRQMQSITWEAVRLLFANKNAGEIDRVTEIWQKSKSASKARNQILSARLPDPDWATSGRGRDTEGKEEGPQEGAGSGPDAEPSLRPRLRPGSPAGDNGSSVDQTFQLSGVPLNAEQEITFQLEALKAHGNLTDDTVIQQQQAAMTPQQRIRATTNMGFALVGAQIAVPISERLRKISPRIAQLLRRMEMGIGINQHSDLNRVKPFIDGLEGIKKDKAVYEQLNLALMNGDTETRDAILAQFNLTIKPVESLLADIKKRMINAGYEIGTITNYFPRKVKDLDALWNHYYGSEYGGELDALMRKTQKRMQKDGRTFGELEKQEVLNQFLASKKTIRTSGPSATKQRTTGIVTPAAAEFYEDSLTALISHINKSADAVGRARFFGKHNVTLDNITDASETFGTTTDINQSIGAYVAEELTDAPPGQAEVVRSMLEARFNQGVMNQKVRWAKTIGYITTMGQLTSTLTQLGDFAFSAYENGFFNTVSTAADVIGGNVRVTRDQFNIETHSAEFASMDSTHKVLDQVFTWTGLKWMDRIGKETLMNGKINMLEKLARTGTLDAKSQATLDASFTPEQAAQVMEDLKAGNLTEDVQFLAYSTLADYQPINLSEFPEVYLRNPNGRIVYMLKTFTVKQLNAFWREGMNKVVFGKTPAERAQGMGNVLRLSAFFWLIGVPVDMLKDWIMGREINLSETAVDNIYKLGGLSNYHIQQMDRLNDPSKFIALYLAPPVPWITEPTKGLSEMAKAATSGEEFKPGNLSLWRTVPVVGGLWYGHFGGGAERRRQESQKSSPTIRL